MKKEKSRMLDLQPISDCKLQPGDEYYPNGIFTFNITRLIEHIEENESEFDLADIEVEYYLSFDKGESLKDKYVNSADLSKPLILAEIAPDRLYNGYPGISKDYYSRGYNVIDGHHRLAKAYREGIKTLSAYVVRMEQHISFMVEGYAQYVEYWNDKLK